MIIIMKPSADARQVDAVVAVVKGRGLDVDLSKGKEVTLVGVIGDKTKLNGANVELLEGVDKVVPVTESYKLCNIKFHPEPTVVRLGNVTIGGGKPIIVAGPCAVENEKQIIETACGVKAAGAHILRGGAYKPRTSPYAFQGLGKEGVRLLRKAADTAGLPCVTEVIDYESLAVAGEVVDMLQIGARNMQNFELLKEVGRVGRPVVLKRGMSATIEEWLNAAEYILASGCRDVVLCERGIRTFERSTRNTLDIAAVPVLKAKTHLPVLVDPSHASGVRAYVPALTRAALAAGADGVMLEVHCDPSAALSDGDQSLDLAQFARLAASLG